MFSARKYSKLKVTSVRKWQNHTKVEPETKHNPHISINSSETHQTAQRHKPIRNGNPDKQPVRNPPAAPGGPRSANRNKSRTTQPPGHRREPTHAIPDAFKIYPNPPHTNIRTTEPPYTPQKPLTKMQGLHPISGSTLETP